MFHRLQRIRKERTVKIWKRKNGGTAQKEAPAASVLPKAGRESGGLSLVGFRHAAGIYISLFLISADT